MKKHLPRIGLTTVVSDGVFFRGNAYDEAVYNNGGVPVSIRPCVPENLLDSYLDMVDGMIFIGGADIPAHFFGEVPHPKAKCLPEFVAQSHLTLVQKAFERRIPVLGICLGMQELNVANGGKLIQDLDTLMPFHRIAGRDQYHRGVLEPDSRLAEILGTREILLNSCHHQAVNPRFLAPGAKAAVHCGEVVEAIEFEGDIFRIGVQWHPERIKDEEHRRKLFSAFLAECASNSGR